MTAFIELVGSLLKIIADAPKRRLDSAKKSYSQWRNGYEVRKEKRRTVADLLHSADALAKSKLRDEAKDQ